MFLSHICIYTHYTCVLNIYNHKHVCTCPVLFRVTLAEIQLMDAFSLLSRSSRPKATPSAPDRPKHATSGGRSGRKISSTEEWTDHEDTRLVFVYQSVSDTAPGLI